MKETKDKNQESREITMASSDKGICQNELSVLNNSTVLYIRKRVSIEYKYLLYPVHFISPSHVIILFFTQINLLSDHRKIH